MRIILAAVVVALITGSFVAGPAEAKKKKNNCKNKKWTVTVVVPKTDKSGRPLKIRLYRIGVRVKGHGFWKAIASPDVGEWGPGSHKYSETDTFGYKCNLRRQVRLVYKCIRYYQRKDIRRGTNKLDWHEDMGNAVPYPHDNKGDFNWGPLGIACD